ASKSPGTGIDPKGTGKDVGGAAREVGRISVQDLKLNAKDILPCMMWSEDGTRFFVLEKEGYLRRIALEGFKEELVLDVNRRCSWLAMSWEGLIVTVPDLQEFWVVDPATLKVKQKVAMPACSRVAAGPASAVVAGVCGDHVSGDHIYRVVDLKGNVTKDLP